MTPSRFSIEVNPALPTPLARLAELATNLRFSWHRPTRMLYSSLDADLWREVGGNPKLFLRYVDQALLERASLNPAYLENYRKVLAGFDAYLREEPAVPGSGDGAEKELVAYFCAEYGFHESFQIYSGGLGVLAGDHCKSASDLGLKFVAVGLLYTQGYFTQTIDKEGNQVAHYRDHKRADLPVEPAIDSEGQEIQIVLRCAGRDIHAKVWRAAVGRVSVYLLDTDVAENTSADREITHKLYGGDQNVRILQEIVLGIGGVRALRALGLKPGVWHINEGHAAFMTVELVRELVSQGMDLAVAREGVAGRCVFTTHTPVAAGHDVFSREMVLSYLGETITELKMEPDAFLALGRAPRRGAVTEQVEPGFNMTRLAIAGTRYQNGVSRIHGGVSSILCADNWPQVPPEDNPIGYVTNGVHVSTFLFQPWADFFDMSMGHVWQTQLNDPEMWKELYKIPDQLFWNVRQTIKAEVLKGLQLRLRAQCDRNGVSDAHFGRLTRWLDPAHPGVLTIGFARRVATYKRATLLFNDIQRLAKLMSDAGRPVVFVFAGKSHPADEPARKLLRDVNAMSARPEFLGRVVFIEDYDMALARLLVAGVDVWLNNPVAPLEASGTSGIKAAINGTLNLSVLDGWWAEAYDHENGWAIAASVTDNEAQRDRDDAETLYELLEDSIVPLYYQLNEQGFSPGWVAKTKRSMATILPRFNMRRAVEDYINGLYRPAARSGLALSSDGYRGARELADWKQRIVREWPGVTLRRLSSLPPRLEFGAGTQVRIAAQLNGLSPEDVAVELVVSREVPHADIQWPPCSSFNAATRTAIERSRVLVRFELTGEIDGDGSHVFAADCAPPWCGRLNVQVRIAPSHGLLTHPYEMGLMKWL